MSEELKTLMDRIYLVRCLRQNKALFLVIIFLILAAFYGHKTNLPITPAFVYNMYMTKSNTKTDSFLLIKTNGSKVLHLYHTFDEPRRMMIYSTLNAYHQGALNGWQDPQQESFTRTINRHPFLRALGKNIGCKKADYDAYLPWLLKYMQAAVDGSIRRVDIYMAYIHFDGRNLPVADSVKHLYQVE